MVQKVQKTMEVSQLQCSDEVVDVLAVEQRQMKTTCTMDVAQLQVPQLAVSGLVSGRRRNPAAEVVQNRVKMLQLRSSDTVVDIPVAEHREVPTGHSVQTVEDTPQAYCSDMFRQNTHRFSDTSFDLFDTETLC